MSTKIHENNTNITIEKNMNKSSHDPEGCGPQCKNFVNFLARVYQA
jgi:hypothetical protein